MLRRALVSMLLFLGCVGTAIDVGPGDTARCTVSPSNPKMGTAVSIAVSEAKAGAALSVTLTGPSARQVKDVVASDAGTATIEAQVTEAGTLTVDVSEGTGASALHVASCSASVTTGGGPTCGDGTCAADETCESCAADCMCMATCEPKSTKLPPGTSHNAGIACLSCHTGSTAHKFATAGTVYKGVGSSTVVGGATIILTDKTGRTVKLVTNGLGNFYTEDMTLQLPFTVKSSLCPSTKEMSFAAESADCNSCHGIGSRIFVD